MTDQTNYDLTIIFEAETAQEQQEQILEATVKAIEGGDGTVTLNTDWGRRKLAYKIDHKPEAHYRFLQFASPTTTLDAIRDVLKVNDNVVRFRIVKQTANSVVLDPAGPPPAPDGSSSYGGRDDDDEGYSRRPSY